MIWILLNTKRIYIIFTGQYSFDWKISNFLSTSVKIAKPPGAGQFWMETEPEEFLKSPNRSRPKKTWLRNIGWQEYSCKFSTLQELYCQCEIFYLFINVRTIFARTIADFFQYRRAACISVLKDQVRMEFEASLQYLLMGAFFTQVRGRSNSSIFYHFSAWQFMFCSASF